MPYRLLVVIVACAALASYESFMSFRSAKDFLQECGLLLATLFCLFMTLYPFIVAFCVRSDHGRTLKKNRRMKGLIPSFGDHRPLPNSMKAGDSCLHCPGTLSMVCLGNCHRYLACSANPFLHNRPAHQEEQDSFNATVADFGRDRWNWRIGQNPKAPRPRSGLF